AASSATTRKLLGGGKAGGEVGVVVFYGFGEVLPQFSARRFRPEVDDFEGFVELAAKDVLGGLGQQSTDDFFVVPVGFTGIAELREFFLGDSLFPNAKVFVLFAEEDGTVFGRDVG